MLECWYRSVGKAGRVDISSVLSSSKRKERDLSNVPHSSRVNQKWQRGWGKGRSYLGRTAAIFLVFKDSPRLLGGQASPDA